ncbi:MAG: Asp-tRNA(Asn)/Glu-tRNA(Gln) amidotransferase subunit GatB [Gammaproteobacteria bacterium]|nr:Asp-tRNA(Asn)/Glu-tRNA(Gln) amidotransferase subunit GatB [Gammaproteobacteria bacterium]MDE0192915.1 Asp-tRNA(Asn)/Glu-tRNA(Gln) amidotransferase subunit GatB [Gammaproteobacteria bacterium]
MSDWESVIGLEVHVQLKTRSKIFSGAPTAFGAPPNAQACAVDLALPGVLPVLNAEAVRMAIVFGLAVEGEIAERCRFDRKSYFYPDLPKGYQISQLDEPIVGGGHLDIETEDGAAKRIHLTRAHLEEDAGKSLHEDYQGKTGIDLNRAGTPLLEVVSEPELASPEEAGRYFRTLHTLVRTLGICDGNLNEGSMRCDANVSVRPRGSTALGERTEIKNLNSFRFLDKALAFEIERQIDRLESGGTVERQTLLYDAERNETRPMRGKELSDDYRYFPDPDLLPVVVTESMLAQARATIPELPAAKRRRYVEELGLTDYDARWLAVDPDTATYFEAAAIASGQPKATANWVMGDVAAAVRREDTAWTEVPVPAAQLGKLIERIEDGSISGKIAKSLFKTLWDDGGEVDELIDSQGLKQVSDSDEIAAIVRQVIDSNPAQVEQVRSGKTRVLGFLVGQAMKASGGKANPKRVSELLREALSTNVSPTCR